MTVLITLTIAGSDAGPFNLYSDVDGFTSAFETGVAKIDLLAGYSSSLVPDPTTIIRVMSINPLCTSYIDLELYPTTTTTTTYLPLAFSTSYSCIPEPNISISAFSITGGSGLYFAGTTYFLDEPSALANSSWTSPISTVTYNVGTTNGSFWIVIIDSVGNILAQEVITACVITTTTTTTTALPNYGIKRCGDLAPFVVAATYPFSIYDVIQFQIGVPGSGPVYCGEVGGIVAGVPDAEIVSPTVYSCGDIVNCP
jgi:hypothetical protein